MEILEFLKWGLDKGVPGLLTLLCLGLAWLSYKLWLRTQVLNEARVGDMKQFIDLANRIHDKENKAVGDLAKAVEFVQRQERRRA